MHDLDIDPMTLTLDLGLHILRMYLQHTKTKFLERSFLTTWKFSLGQKLFRYVISGKFRGNTVTNRTQQLQRCANDDLFIYFTYINVFCDFVTVFTKIAPCLWCPLCEKMWIFPTYVEGNVWTRQSIVKTKPTVLDLVYKTSDIWSHFNGNGYWAVGTWRTGNRK